MSKLINQGSFGCIFRPGFNCKGKVTKQTKNSITKLQVKDFNADNEILIGSIIKTIPNYSFFFVPVISHCSIGLASLNNKYIDKCDILSRDNPDYLLLEMPYIENISFKKLFSDSTRSNKHLFLIFIETFQYLALAIKQLLDKDIVQFDLKEDNILYSVKYENPLLIDYGISIPFSELNSSNLKQYFYVYGPDYYIWPLEVHAINFLLHHEDKLTEEAIESMCQTFVKSNSGLNIFSDDFKKDYLDMCKAVLRPYINVKRDIVIKELLKYYKTWDQYSLSILYLKFFNILFYEGFFKSKLVLTFSELLLINISPDPRKRLDIEETIKKYRDILFINETVMNYQILLNNLDYDSIKN